MIKIILETHVWGALIGCAIAGVLWSAPARADTRSAVASPNLSELSERIPTELRRSGRVEGQINVSFKGRVAGLGRYSVRLNRVRRKNWPASFAAAGISVSDTSDLTLYQGTVVHQMRGGGAFAPVAASVVQKPTYRLVRISFLASNRFIIGAKRFYDIVLKVDTSGRVLRQRVARLPSTSFATSGCGAEELLGASRPQPVSAPGVSQDQSSGPRALAATGMRVIDIATDADYEYYLRHGADTNTQMAQAINLADAIYRSELGLTFSITDMRSLTSPSQPLTSTDAQILLGQYGTYLSQNPHPGAHDINHLFTGKALLNGVAGIAWVGVVCRSSSSNNGLTMRGTGSLGSLDYLIFAHEVGHNFSAAHDSALPRSIMYPSVSSSQTSFSATSRTQIDSFVATYGSCLAEEPSNPTPTPTATPSPTATQTPTPTSTPLPTSSPGPGVPTATVTPTIVPTVAPTVKPRGELRVKRKVTRLSSGKVRIVAVVLDSNGERVADVLVRLLEVRRNRRGLSSLRVRRSGRTDAAGAVRFKGAQGRKYKLQILTTG